MLTHQPLWNGGPLPSPVPPGPSVPHQQSYQRLALIFHLGTLETSFPSSPRATLLVPPCLMPCLTCILLQPPQRPHRLRVTLSTSQALSWPWLRDCPGEWAMGGVAESLGQRILKGPQVEHTPAAPKAGLSGASPFRPSLTCSFDHLWFQRRQLLHPALHPLPHALLKHQLPLSPG